MYNVTEKVFEFEIKKRRKPTIRIHTDADSTITCLVDTGADMPVWFTGETALQRAYPNAYKTNDVAKIIGFSTEPLENVPVWVIPEFVLTDKEGKTLTYHNLHICVIKPQKASTNMLMSLTMLNRTKFYFDYKSSARVASFSIESFTSDFYVRPIYVSVGCKVGRLFSKVQVYLQNEFGEEDSSKRCVNDGAFLGMDIDCAEQVKQSTVQDTRSSVNSRGSEASKCSKSQKKIVISKSNQICDAKNSKR